jgi:secreted trypsin-like serine protease
MKFSIIALLGFAGLASANLRLPLPLEIIQKHPHLMHEDLFPDNRIVYGKPVAQGEAPYQIGLIRSGSFICGGSIINQNTILTAAHCVYNYESRPDMFKIRYGTLDRTDSSKDAAVRSIVRHERYSSSKIDYDVAVIILQNPITPSDNAQPVTMDTTDPTTTDNLLLTGWGRNENSALPGMLQKADSLKFITQATCQSKWGSVNAITPRMLCVESTSQSACNGDSGGPLVSMSTKKLVGVVSWGASGCRVGSYPNVFGRIVDLKPWIESKMG